MKQFAKLFERLDQTTKTTRKLEALVDYFSQAQAADAAWAIYFLCGEKLQRLIPTKLLRQWSAEESDIDPWMFEECYEIVGDLAETMALVLPAKTRSHDETLAHWVEQRLLPLKALPESKQHEFLQQYWQQLSKPEALVMHKLMTGSFRIGVSRKLVTKALGIHSGIDAEVIAHRLMGQQTPSADWYRQLLDPDTEDALASRPYPFCLAHPLEQDAESLGDISLWQAEWKWDGIRAQLVKRQGETSIWSRGEDIMTDRFPELIEAAKQLPDEIVIDGELVGWKNNQVLPFSEMQRRIGRKRLGKKILSDVPVAMIAFDLLELNGQDLREKSLEERSEMLETIMQPSGDPTLQLSPIIVEGNWSKLNETRQQCRQFQTEGLMLKRRDSKYQVGRARGDWWKWKIEPYTIDAVLIYAQRGHGRRASLYTDYTFAVWSDGELVPFAKAYSGLTDAEIRRVDRFVRQNTLQRFGPVRSVNPELVFELAFENVQASSRHKSGIAVRFPRIKRWREDLKIQDADSLESIQAMMHANQDIAQSGNCVLPVDGQS